MEKIVGNVTCIWSHDDNCYFYYFPDSWYDNNIDYSHDVVVDLNPESITIIDDLPF